MKKFKVLLGGLLFLIFTSVANAVPVILEIEFDEFPEETSFGIWGSGSVVGDVYDGIAYDVAASSAIGFGDGFVFSGDFSGEDSGPWQFVWDLDFGSYTFGIFDSFGDGICCSFGSGAYSLSVNGLVTVTGASFSESEITEFNIVSEPSIFTLLGLGILGVVLRRRLQD